MTRPLILLVLLLSTTVLAQSNLPSTSVRAGPYLLQVQYLNEVRGGQNLKFRVRAATSLDQVKLAIRAVPGTSVDAVPVKASLRPDPRDAQAMLGEVNLPVRGLWVLDVYANGPRGEGTANAPVLAATAPTIPLWFGWLIGLTPVFFIVGFVTLRASRAPVALS